MKNKTLLDKIKIGFKTLNFISVNHLYVVLKSLFFFPFYFPFYIKLTNVPLTLPKEKRSHPCSFSRSSCENSTPFLISSYSNYTTVIKQNTSSDDQHACTVCIYPLYSGTSLNTLISPFFTALNMYYCPCYDKICD